MIHKRKLAPGVAERIAEAQHVTHFHIGGIDYPRRPFWPNGIGPAVSCPDCGCSLGMLHIVGCDMERCARCGLHQAISCACLDGNDDAEEEFA